MTLQQDPHPAPSALSLSRVREREGGAQRSQGEGASPTPVWPALIRLAAERFGVPPRDFWALSLREWRALAAPPAADRPLSRAELDALLHLHPDAPA